MYAIRSYYEFMNWYCEYSEKHPHHKSYHDTEYGFPTDDNTVIFERLSLEIFQAGLSWDLMIKKRSGLRKAFADFDIDKIATFGEEFVLKQLDNPDIIRSRRKIEAIIYNAKQAQALIKEYGSLAKWIKINHPLPLEGWTKLFKTQFKFIGPVV